MSSRSTTEHPPFLLPGETVKLSESNVRIVVRNLVDFPFANARVVITNGRLVLLPVFATPYRGPIVVPLAAIESLNVEQITQGSKKDLVTQIEVLSRDFQCCVILLPTNSTAVKGVLALLTNHRQFSSHWPYDHFIAAAQNPKRPPNAASFAVYDAAADFERMGISGVNEGSFVVNTTLNAKFYTPSYPQTLCFPAGLTDAQLAKSAQFRSKRRLPAVIWHSKKEGGVLLRSSQPHVGIGRTRCEEDETLLSLVAAVNFVSSVVLICDARPRINAVANHATSSGGTESISFYSFAIVRYGSIENIHNVRESFEKLQSCLTRPSETLHEFLKRFRRCGWQDHLYSILACSEHVASWISEGKSALVHCSDGWDRTPQVVSLVQLQLDSFYRSVRGFCILIEKDWCHFGHMFVWRHGQVAGDDPKLKERSPIFLQFLACVAQLLAQYPTAFEFNSDFLVSLHRKSVSGMYGTFAANEPRERVHYDLNATTMSVWESFLSRDTGRIKEKWRNPLYYSCDSVILWKSDFYQQSWWQDCYHWPMQAYKPSPSRQQMISQSLDRKLTPLETRVEELEARLAVMSDANPKMDDLCSQMEQLRRENARLTDELCQIHENGFREKELTRMARLAEEGASPVDSMPRSSGLGGSGKPRETIWVPDDMADSCHACNRIFSFVHRIHHCRVCGAPVCGNCSSHRMLLERDGTPQRVCDACFASRFLQIGGKPK